MLQMKVGLEKPTLIAIQAARVTWKKRKPYINLQKDMSSVESIQSKSSRSFSEEYSVALKGKIDFENKEMIQSGRLKRWTPLREDQMLRLKLMECMRQNLIQTRRILTGIDKTSSIFQEVNELVYNTNK